MREILFRGKRKNGLEWFYGSYMEHYYSSRYGRVSAIFANDDAKCKTYRIPVDQETVGQFTGLTDKNGRKIFEGDIVKALRICNQEVWTGYVVMWNGCFALKDAKTRNVPAIDLFNVYEVIGNIHDNPELLEGGEEDGK